MAKKRKLTVMVSSSVYGIEELLDRIFAILTKFGYEVWMSHKGTVPVFSDNHAWQDCLAAVEKCDLFLSIITTQYGSGKDGKGLSITHQELLKAIDIKKPRWVLAHDQVIFARSLLAKLGHDTAAKRAALKLEKNTLISDLRVIDMYDAAIRHDIQLVDRDGNWVQKFVTPDDAALFASAQFYRYQEVEQFINEHLVELNEVEARLRSGHA